VPAVGASHQLALPVCALHDAQQDFYSRQQVPSEGENTGQKMVTNMAKCRQLVCCLFIYPFARHEAKVTWYSWWGLWELATLHQWHTRTKFVSILTLGIAMPAQKHSSLVASVYVFWSTSTALTIMCMRQHSHLFSHMLEKQSWFGLPY